MTTTEYLKDVRDFRGVVEREGATLGLFITLGADCADGAGGGAGRALCVAVGESQVAEVVGTHGGSVARGESFAIPSAALLMGVSRARRMARAETQAAGVGGVTRYPYIWNSE